MTLAAMEFALNCHLIEQDWLMTPVEKTGSIMPSQQKFVGRENLIIKARNALRAGTHVFVHGPFGIGKTSFANATIRSMGLPLLTVSVQDSASDMTSDLLRQLRVLGYPGRRKTKGRPKTTRQYQSFKSLKAELIRWPKSSDVLILDDVFSVSHQKLAYLRFLQTLGYKFVVNIESKKFPSDLFLLRSVCQPHIQLTLPRLSAAEARQLIKSQALKFSKPLSDEALEKYVKILNGYPLMIVEMFRPDNRSRNVRAEVTA